MKRSIFIKIVIFMSLLAILINCFSLSCFAYDIPSVNLGENLTYQDFISNSNVYCVCSVGVAGTEDYIDIKPSISFDSKSSDTFTVHVPFIYGMDYSGFRHIRISFFFSPFSSSAITDLTKVFNYSIDNITFDYSLSMSNPDKLGTPISNILIQNGDYKSYSCLMHYVPGSSSSGVVNSIDYSSLVYFYDNFGSLNLVSKDSSVNGFYNSFYLYSYPFADLTLSSYDITFSNFLINDTSVYFNSVTADTDNITSSVDNKLNNLSHDISLPTPNTGGVINSISNAINNVDAVSAGVLFSWTNDSFVVTILLMVISFGIICYVLYGRRG